MENIERNNITCNSKYSHGLSLPQNCGNSKSAPNSRTGSFKHRTRGRVLLNEERRRNSLPIFSDKTISASYNGLTDENRRLPRRVRSFKTSSKGIAFATKGDRRDSSTSTHSGDDSMKKRLSSETSDDNVVCGYPVSGFYRVCIMGADTVGKRTLTYQFVGSNLMSSNVFDVGDIEDNLLSLVLDNEESTIEFVEFSNQEDPGLPLDAYIVVFSVHERPTYDVAIDCLKYIRNEVYSDRPIVLVANKVDLVRKRQVSHDEAIRLASDFKCKYIETSATLNHQVDELLVGILKQIKLQLNPIIEKNTERKQRCSSVKDIKDVLSKLFHVKTKIHNSPEVETVL